LKALTIGGAMIDTIAIIDSDRIERMTMLNADSSFLLLEEGRKTEASDISTHCGGGAINVAVALARLGLDVAVLVKLGQDARADTVLARLTQERVCTRWALRDPRAPTGAAVHVSSHDRNAAVFTFRGANTLLEPQDLRDDAFAVDIVHVSNLSNKSADRFPEIVKRAKAQGAMVSANPGVRQLSTRSGAFQQCLSSIDILTLNRGEADVLVPSLVARFGEGGPVPPVEPGEQPPSLLVRGLGGGGYEMSLVAFLAALSSFGPKAVVITDGSRGAYLGLNKEILFCTAGAVATAGTAGAGDPFSATFTAYHAMGRRPADSLRAASINAASVVSYVDTQTGLLTSSAIEERLAKADNRIRCWSA
jgi:ribokinase